MSRLYPVILAGGSGTRFWPLSRSARPKQFLPLSSEKPLISEAFERVRKLAKPSQILVVCGKAHAPLVRRLLKRLPPANVLVEPQARNTAPAIALAALHIFRREPEGILAVLPSDHHVVETDRFVDCIRGASALARDGFLVTLGIRPNRPETGFGYVRVGDPLPGGGWRVRAFVEKPNLETARRYLESGEYLWNSGIFLFRASAILSAFRRHLPQLSGGLDGLLRAKSSRGYAKQLARVFRKTPAVSIDYGVMEKADNIAVIPADFGWSDVGSFTALAEVRPADAQGNVVVGDKALLVGCQNCVVICGSRLVTVVGMSDSVVVDSNDAVMVIPKAKAQEVRRAVEALRERGWSRFL